MKDIKWQYSIWYTFDYFSSNIAKQHDGWYHFTIYERFSYFDWFNGYFEMDIKIILANRTDYDFLINNVASTRLWISSFILNYSSTAERGNDQAGYNIRVYS